jgi:hypothetical protein
VESRDMTGSSPQSFSKMIHKLQEATVIVNRLRFWFFKPFGRRVRHVRTVPDSSDFTTKRTINKDPGTPNGVTFKLSKKCLHGSIAFVVTMKFISPEIIEGHRRMRRVKLGPGISCCKEAIAMHMQRYYTFGNPCRCHRRVMRRAEGVSIQKLYDKTQMFTQKPSHLSDFDFLGSRKVGLVGKFGAAISRRMNNHSDRHGSVQSS